MTSHEVDFFKGSATTALQSAENRAEYQAFLEVLPVPVFTLDENMRVDAINAAATEVTGWQPGQAIGRQCNDLLHGEPCPACMAKETRMPQRHVKSALTRPDGTHEQVYVDTVPLGGGVAVVLREDSMREALRRAGGCVTRAARLLGIHRTTLWRRMREEGLDRAEFLPK